MKENHAELCRDLFIEAHGYKKIIEAVAANDGPDDIHEAQAREVAENLQALADRIATAARRQ